MLYHWSAGSQLVLLAHSATIQLQFIGLHIGRHL